MLFPKELWPGLADGSIRVAFRRWKRPTVKAGGTLRTPAGVLAIDAVSVTDRGHAVLRLIERHPARPAAELAAVLGQDKVRFKRRVRRLKELGLTDSLNPGYRLSPPGRCTARPGVHGLTQPTWSPTPVRTARRPVVRAVR